MMIIQIILLTLSFVSANVVPLQDSILFAFEKCRALNVNLEKGQLSETVTSSFDLHCLKSSENVLEFTCNFFDSGSNKKLGQETFTGGSHLGKAELVDKNGKRINFLIGKKFASYASGSEPKLCVGIFIFEKDALKQKSSSLKFD